MTTHEKARRAFWGCDDAAEWSAYLSRERPQGCTLAEAVELLTAAEALGLVGAAE